jgi:hypothetical protein
MVVPVMPLARGLARKAAAVPTSSAVRGAVRGEFVAQYSTIFSMMPIALAARDANGPAEIVFTLTPYFLPASNARVLVSLSSAAFADDMPPPYPGITRSLAMYVSDTNDPPSRISGASLLTIEIKEYALTPIAVR